MLIKIYLKFLINNIKIGGMLMNYIKLCRPKQWIKNSFVFGALIFSANFLHVESVLKTLIACIAFCLVSSSVYIMNDIIDANQDKKHPTKKDRPIASGKVKVNSAIVLMIFLVVVSFTIMYYLSKIALLFTVLYFVNNILYSIRIKHIVLLDVISIAIGFLLRIIVGGIVINVHLSIWILLCTFFISLFLGFEKRRGELLLLEESSSKHRKILDEYCIDLVKDLSNIVCTCTVMFYAVYTVVGTSYKYMVITNVFVVYGIFRYRYLLGDKRFGGNPTDLILSDRGIMIDIILYSLSSIIIMAV